MTLSDALAVAQTLSLLAGLLVAAGTLRRRADERTVALTTMQVDIRYIKERVACAEEAREAAARAQQAAENTRLLLDAHLRRDHSNERANVC